MKFINAIIGTTSLIAASAQAQASLSNLRAANRALQEEGGEEPVECPCWTPEELNCVNKVNAHSFSCGGTSMLDNAVMNHGQFSMTNPGENPPDMCAFILRTYAIGGTVCMRLVGSETMIVNLSNDDRHGTAESKVGQHEACLESIQAKCDKMGMGTEEEDGGAAGITSGGDGPSSGGGGVNLPSLPSIDFDVTNPFAPSLNSGDANGNLNLPSVNVPGINDLIGTGSKTAKNISKQAKPVEIGSNSGD